MNECILLIHMQILKPSVREDLIRVATEEFRTHGFEQASLRQIARQAGMSVGNVYRYYPNKMQLFEAVIEPALNEFNAILQMDIQDYPHPLVAFKALIQTFVQTISNLIKEDEAALFVLLNDKASSDLIQFKLSIFLKQLASVWFQQMNVSPSGNDLLMEMLAKGIFYGVMHAVEKAETIDSDTLVKILEDYLNLHLYMTYAYKETPDEEL